jgi:integrase
VDEINQELANFERIVPLADEATMVLKAHLLLEQSLWMFISERVPDKALITKLRSEHSPVSTGKALIQLAEAVAAGDGVPISNAETLWPTLYKVNDLRNRFVHDLEPSRERVQKPMREIVKVLLGEGSGHLTRDFYYATKLMIGYLVIDRKPSKWSDTQ